MTCTPKLIKFKVWYILKKAMVNMINIVHQCIKVLCSNVVTMFLHSSFVFVLQYLICELNFLCDLSPPGGFFGAIESSTLSPMFEGHMNCRKHCILFNTLCFASMCVETVSNLKQPHMYMILHLRLMALRSLGFKSSLPSSLFEVAQML